MRNYLLTVILLLSCFSFVAQTSTGIHHIKYLDINTANSDFSVDFYDDDRVVFATATSDRVINSSKRQAHLDLFEGNVGEQGEILGKVRNGGILSKKVTKTGATFSNDNKTVYFTTKKYRKRKSSKPENSELFRADIDENGNWINVEKLSINKRDYTIESPSLNKEGNKLYFSSNLPTTVGGKDIFVVEVKEDGTLGEPKNLGPVINTRKDEITPFIANNNFLYFSSNGRTDSMGGFDIYASEALENTVSAPLHLDAPINSINSDFAYIVKEDNKGYFTSNRLQGQNNNDIYSFYIEPDKPVECYQQVIGTVRDKETEKVLSGATITITTEEGVEIAELTTDENGNYAYDLGCRGSFTVKASKKDYSEEEHIVNTANYTESPSLEINQSLTYNFKEVEDKVVINVNPIYFGFDKWNITKASANELDKIVEIMKNDESLIVESASHTDSRGTKAYNQILSERRAKATVDYIVSKGINRDRIKSKGYGESQLINNCADGVRCSIENHKLNRRTEFVIVNKQVLNLPKDRHSEIIKNSEKSVAVTEEVEQINNEVVTEETVLNQQPQIVDDDGVKITKESSTVDDQTPERLTETEEQIIEKSSTPEEVQTTIDQQQENQTEKPINNQQTSKANLTSVSAFNTEESSS